VIWEWTDKPGQPPKPLCIAKSEHEEDQP
jgi:hypothetical protein